MVVLVVVLVLVFRDALVRVQEDVVVLVCMDAIVRAEEDALVALEDVGELVQDVAVIVVVVVVVGVQALVRLHALQLVIQLVHHSVLGLQLVW